MKEQEAGKPGEDTMRLGMGLPVAEKSRSTSSVKLKAVALNWGLGLLSALALGGNAVAQTVCVPPPSGMISWWDGDEVSGATTSDIQGGNDGTLINGTSVAPGNVGQAFSLDGVDDYIEAGNDLSVRPQFPFSVDAWVNVDNFDRVAGPVISSADPGGNGLYSGFSVYILGNKSNIGEGHVFAIFGSNLGCCAGTFRKTFHTSDSVISLGTWHHIAAVYVNTSTVEIYVDGVQRSTAEVGTATSMGYSTNNKLLIGLRFNPNVPSFSSYFSGQIDEVELFDRALSAGEIQAIFNAGSAGKCKAVSVINVGVDIKPGSFPNSVNLGSGGAVPVAILGSETLDVFDIDTDTLTLGTAGIKTVGKALKLLCSVEDVSGDFVDGPEGWPDGFDDLVCHFVTVNIVPEEGDTEAKVSGDFIFGGSFEGTDSINIVP